METNKGKKWWLAALIVVIIATFVSGGLVFSDNLHKQELISIEKHRTDSLITEKHKRDSINAVIVSERQRLAEIAAEKARLAAEQARRDSIEAAEQAYYYDYESSTDYDYNSSRYGNSYNSRQSPHNNDNSSNAPAWLEGNWRYVTYIMGNRCECRVGISGKTIVVMFDGQMYYSGSFTIKGDRLFFNRGNGSSDYLVIDEYNQRLMVDNSTPMRKF